MSFFLRTFLIIFLVLVCLGFIFYLSKPETFIRVLQNLDGKGEVRLLFVGDLLLDRSIRTYAEQHGEDYIFACLKEKFGEMDAVVANLEGPITAYPSVSQFAKIDTSENMRFSMPVSSAEALLRHNISIVNLGNNHIFDFGPEGIETTKEALTEAGVAYFGDPAPTAPRSRLIEVGSQKVAFVNYNDWFGSSGETVGQIALYADRYPVVVYTHWGEEYVSASERMKGLARKFVDAGADIVIGSHPHIVLEEEIYKKAPIYYSLGNFIFDQYWDEDVRTGLALEVDFSGGKITGVDEHILDIPKNRQTCFK